MAKYFKLPLDSHVDERLRRLIIVGLVDQVCRRATPTQCTDWGYKYVATQRCGKTPYWDVHRKRVVYVHPRSTVALVNPAPEWLVYTCATTSQRASSTGGGGAADSSGGGGGAEAAAAHGPQRVFVRGVTGVLREWLDTAGFRDPSEAADND